MGRTRLIDIVRASDQRLVAPLMGFPGAKLTRSTIRQNEFNSDLHYRTIRMLVERYRPDVAFFMMDLSIEAGAIGLPVSYPLNESPTVEQHPVRSVEDLEAFRVLDPMADARLKSFVETLGRLAEHDDVTTAAYVTGPFTLAGLMMGATDVAIATLDDPELVDELVTFAEGVITPYAKLLVDAGASVVAILEPTATFLSPRAFQRFSGSVVQRIAGQLDAVTVLHICGDTTHLLSAMAATGVDGLSLDGPVDFAAAAQVVPPETVLIGNVDPVRVMVEMDPDGIWEATTKLLTSMEPFENFFLSTGCDLPPETPHENIAAFMEAARAYKYSRPRSFVALSEPPDGR